MKVIILAPTRSLSSYQHDHPSRNYNVIILVLKLKLEVEHTDGALHLPLGELLHRRRTHPSGRCFKTVMTALRG